MPIETYQTDEALALLARIGWPEWEDHNIMYALAWDGKFFQIDFQGKGHGARFKVASHVALCIIRNHLREWLDEHGPWTMCCDNYDQGLLEEVQEILDREAA